MKMAGNVNPNILLLLFFVGLSGTLGFNASRDINMLEYPEPMKTIILGQNLELRWRYLIKPSSYNNWKISLYEYNFNSGTKTKLLVLFQSGLTMPNPNIWPQALQKLNMELSFEKAKISIPNATFDHSMGGYGIIFQNNYIVDPNGILEKFTEISVTESKVVDVPSQHVENGSCLWSSNFLILFMAVTLFVTKDA